MMQHAVSAADEERLLEGDDHDRSRLQGRGRARDRAPGDRRLDDRQQADGQAVPGRPEHRHHDRGHGRRRRRCLARYLKAEVSLYRLRRNGPVSAEGAATLLANILAGTASTRTTRGSSSAAWTRRAVTSSRSTRRAAASRTATARSGPVPRSSTAFSRRDTPGTSTTSDGIDLALRGLTVAMKRDSASGDGYLCHVITAKEYHEMSDDEH